MHATAAFRRRLLATASTVVLATTLAGAAARADDGDNSLNRFTFEMGGGLQFYNGGNVTWINDPNPVDIGPKNGWDITGKATFEPAQSPWIFTLAVQYGRSGRKNESISSRFSGESGSGYYLAKADHREDHIAVDFEVGQDVGLGMLGMNGSSVISGGLRYAHFEANTNVALAYYSVDGGVSTGAIREHRTFSGVGPMISWDASTPFFNSDGPLSFDWGIDGAVLFGTHSASVDVSYSGVGYSAKRSKTVVVPAADAYAAISYHCDTCGAKASLGYRFDSYFNVLDGGGLGGPHGVDRIFHGPYLSVAFETGG